ncbi:hypothetical protein E8E13_004922 [Curvularia kusanoi]|uniref:Uncharacterized protein n=1 Tax=Curvularia kusanoi TaxID=90978 RepID=A0A9P4TM62_CURKU|nr:hypothetical protein E8E13_004922 [Curvularia kusanoi]
MECGMKVYVFCYKFGKGQIMSTSMKNDGIVCVAGLMTLRLKEPTVDLSYKNGHMYVVDEGQMIKIVNGCKNMIEGMIYELSVSRDKVTNSIMLSNPKERLSKHSPNAVDIVRRAMMVVSGTRIGYSLVRHREHVLHIEEVRVRDDAVARKRDQEGDRDLRLGQAPGVAPDVPLKFLLHHDRP